MEDATMNIPTDLKYSKDHEWVRVVDPGQVSVGITDYAQRQLGGVVYVEQPGKGDRFDQFEPFGSVESEKTVSELYAPVTGKVVAVNGGLEDAPENVNKAPYGDGWMIVVEIDDVSELDKLWSAEKYTETFGQG